MDAPSLNVVEAFPAKFLSKYYNEPFILKVMQEVSGTSNWRQGDPRKFEPDYFCEDIPFEFTIASDQHNKDTFIRRFRAGEYTSENLESDIFRFIHTAVQKKASKQYAVSNVNVCVLCLLDLSSWVFDEYGSQAHYLVDRPRANFFSELKTTYISSGKFANIYIIFPSFDARWWVWDVALDEKGCIQLSERDIVSGEYPFVLLKSSYDKLFRPEESVSPFL